MPIILINLYAIWPKSKDLYPTFLKATQPPSDLKSPQVSVKFARLACINIILFILKSGYSTTISHNVEDTGFSKYVVISS